MKDVIGSNDAYLERLKRVIFVLTIIIIIIRAQKQSGLTHKT